MTRDEIEKMGRLYQSVVDGTSITEENCPDCGKDSPKAKWEAADGCPACNTAADDIGEETEEANEAAKPTFKKGEKPNFGKKGDDDDEDEDDDDKDDDDEDEDEDDDKKPTFKKGEKPSFAKEEVDQIDELSKSTLGSYTKKAAKRVRAATSLSKSFQADADLNTKKMNKHSPNITGGDNNGPKDPEKLKQAKGAYKVNKGLANDFKRKAQNGVTGIGRAADRMSKESLDDIAKEIVAEGIKKHHTTGAAYRSMWAEATGDRADHYKGAAKAQEINDILPDSQKDFIKSLEKKAEIEDENKEIEQDQKKTKKIVRTQSPQRRNEPRGNEPIHIPTDTTKTGK